MPTTKSSPIPQPSLPAGAGAGAAGRAECFPPRLNSATALLLALPMLGLNACTPPRRRRRRW